LADKEKLRELEGVASAKSARDYQHVILAYGVLWALFAGYGIFLWRRSARLRADMTDLRSASTRRRRERPVTLGHFLYIPGVLCLGLLIGYILGGRASEVASADRQADAGRRAARLAAREADAKRPRRAPAAPLTSRQRHDISRSVFDPSYTEEQHALIATARKFTREVIIPQAHEYDESEKFPVDIFNAAFELGLMNVEVPEAYGGLGLGTLDGCLMAEELAYGCAAIATSIMCNHLGALPLMIAGSEAQKERYLGWLTREPIFASYACSEPEAGSDVAAMKTRLTRDGDGWRLTGQKRWITNAGHAASSPASPPSTPSSATRASPASSSRPTGPASASARRRRSSASAPPRPAT
jgi:hypothetical protein